MRIYFNNHYKIHTLIISILLIVNTNIAFANKIYKKVDFWNKQQKGANIFNYDVTLEDIKAAKKYKIKFIRLAFDKFISSYRDFLIGNADDYHHLMAEDLKKVKEVLNLCAKEDMPVVITMLTLPGSRWKQNNHNIDDLRIWQEEKYQIQAAKFWQDLAFELKEHAIIVGYNILNEPHPERIFAANEVHIDQVQQDKVQRMIYAVYQRIITQIRLVDQNTPIILDSSAYADPQTFKLLIPHKSQHILYSFHMYEPYEYTNHKKNKGKFSYPGNIHGFLWDKTMLEKYMSVVINFQSKHNIPSNRILVGEFGGYRKSLGLAKYFNDLITIFNKAGWHFAFYAFREDAWDGMDYELGDQKLPWSYWQAIKRGEKPILQRTDKYPAFLIIKNALDKDFNKDYL